MSVIPFPRQMRAKTPEPRLIGDIKDDAMTKMLKAAHAIADSMIEFEKNKQLLQYVYNLQPSVFTEGDCAAWLTAINSMKYPLSS